MPTVPRPNSTAFGGGALAQGQFAIANAAVNVGRTFGRIGQNMRAAEQKELLRQDTVVRLTDTMADTERLDMEFAKLRDSNPTTPQQVDEWRNKIQSDIARRDLT